MDVPTEVLDALMDVELSLLTLSGVNGVGVGLREVEGEVLDELAIRILVEDASFVPVGLPQDIAGVEVCIIERHYEPVASPDLKRYKELRGGIHVNNPAVSDDGTLGAIVQDTSAIASGQRLGLSCFHVVGDRGSPFPNTVWQPDNPPFPSAASPKDNNLGPVQKVSFPNTPVTVGIGPVFVGLVDAAVFSLDEAFGHNRTVSRSVMGQDEQDPPLASAVTGTAQATVTDTEVSKRGAITRVTHGRVVAPYMSTPWLTSLGPNRYLLGSIELRVDPVATPSRVFAQRGDSGALVLLRNQPTAVGLLWGAADSGAWATMTDIGRVESALEISAVWA